MEDIKIHSSLYDYEVEFIDININNILEETGENVTYVIDQNVYNLYEHLFKNLNQELIYFIDAKEENKDIDSVLELIDFWRDKKIKKNWKVIAVGGGITQDIVTFASNIYLRNIDWYFVPTTLLAMCDSCIGGKCGINRGRYKNQLGVFYPPKKIFISTAFLETLSTADVINGWGELLKFSLTKNNGFFEQIEKINDCNSCTKMDDYIYNGLFVKKEIIELDEFEGDLRRVLNYGHTFGHALEAYTHNAIPHGTAVIWGIDVVNYIAMRENIFSKEDYLRVKSLIKKVFLTDEIIIENSDELYEIISTDKKVKNNTIYLAVPKSIGELSIYPMDLDEKLRKIFKDYLESTHEFYCD